MYPIRMLVGVVTVLVIGTTALQPTRAAERLCFPNVPTITACIEGRFLEFWRQNGGLAVFGYPLGPVQDINHGTDRDGNDIWVPTQMFERTSFELHPEYARPYDVLLVRWGATLLSLHMCDWQTFPKSGNEDGEYFPETGQVVPAFPFLEYWQSHGLDLGDPDVSDRESLALFGMPLSNVIQGRRSDGTAFLYQWYERARFEYDQRYGVRLGRLVGEVLRDSPEGAAIGPFGCYWPLDS